MSIFAELSDEALAILKQAGQAIETFLFSETQKLIAQVKASDLGTLALNLVQVFEGHSGSGADKMEMLVATLVPALQKFEANGGLSGLVTSIEDFAREFAQSAYNDFKAALAKVAGSS